MGSVRGVFDLAGQYAALTSYAPYGSPFEQYASPSTLGFTGEQTVTGGLNYLRARYYNPSIGTFLTRDPFSGTTNNAMSRNGYSYVHGNPTNWTDFSGREIDPQTLNGLSQFLQGLIASGGAAAAGLCVGPQFAVCATLVGTGVITVGLFLLVRDSYDPAFAAYELSIAAANAAACPRPLQIATTTPTPRAPPQTSFIEPTIGVLSDPLIDPTDQTIIDPLPTSTPYPISTSPGTPFPVSTPGGFDLMTSTPMAVYVVDYVEVYELDRQAKGLAPLPEGYEVHHRIPQAYRDNPNFTNFPFDAPSNLRGVPGWRAVRAGTYPLNIHSQITANWESWRRQYPNATRQEVINHADIIDMTYGHHYWEAQDPPPAFH